MTVVGIAAGQQLMGKIPPDTAKALVGGILAALIVRRQQPLRQRRSG